MKRSSMAEPPPCHVAAIVGNGGERGNGFNTEARRRTKTHGGPGAPRKARGVLRECRDLEHDTNLRLVFEIPALSQHDSPAVSAGDATGLLPR
jgi:hypothetical protein